jgi:transcriptional regulator
MYLPKLFLETDRDRLHRLIEAHSFGCLIVPKEPGEVEIAHLPFVLDRDVGPSGRLRAHVARANPIWRLLTDGRPAIAVFSGPHGYVSPRWYERPGEQVPTWNYAVVHAHGRALSPMSREDLVSLLDDLVTVHEQSATEPWTTARLDPTLRDELLRAIVGFTLTIERLEGKLKLSQNRSPSDHARVVRGLSERGWPDDLEMVGLMTAKDKPR